MVTLWLPVLVSILALRTNVQFTTEPGGGGAGGEKTAKNCWGIWRIGYLLKLGPLD